MLLDKALSALTASLVLASVVSAGGNSHGKRRHHRRAAKRACMVEAAEVSPTSTLYITANTSSTPTGSASISSSPSPSSSSSSASASTTMTSLTAHNLMALEGDGEVVVKGHWAVHTITTSDFVADSTSTLAISTSTSGSISTPSSSASTSAQDSAETVNALGITLALTLGDGPASTQSASAPTWTATASAPASSTTLTPLSSKHVFAHFMVGITYLYTQSDWEADMSLAKSKGITGFALNIGVDSYSEKQLDNAYAAAAAVGFEAFISFDFNWYTIANVSGVTNMLSRYVGQTAQLKVDGKPFVSTFIGDGFDWQQVATNLGMELYAVPFWQPSQANADTAGLAGLFSWDAWPGQLGNVPVLQNMTTDRDELYISEAIAAGKTYMAPVSPWFFTHFSKEVSYSKNWLFYSEMLWKTRWDQILSMGSQLNLIEIVTWNDYGESHYIGPYDTPHTDDGSSHWAAGFDHTPMLDMAVPYIEAFKAGATTPTISQEMLVYWHRPHLKDVQCDSTDNCGSRPTGWDMVEDVVFVAAMTKSGGSVTVNSGSNAAFVQQVAPGVQVFSVPMGLGTQSFAMTTSAGGNVQGSSNLTITDQCWNGIYNFNFHSGSLKV